MQKEIAIKCNWTVKKADIWRVGRLIKDCFELKNPLFDIVEKIQNGELGKMANFVMNQNNDFIVYETHNIVPNVVRYQLANAIIGIAPATTFEANYIALGDDATPPAHTDTTLGNETIRATFTNRYTIDNIAYLDKFFSSAEVSGNTYLEAGVFCDGTITPDSGFLLSKISMDETIGANEVLTINCAISINSAT